MSKKTLFAPHTAVLTAVTALGWATQPDLLAQKALTGTIRSMKLKSEHVEEVADTIHKRTTQVARTGGRFSKAVIADLEDTLKVVQENFATAQNGAGAPAHQAALSAGQGDHRQPEFTGVAG